ncbi:MAG TPA: 3-dehydro-L-gulonate 2-dehydrogenase [Panacibacter sp.]|nr:3-dehydro-L-gulonate 2-dehydrogenase [Panacibacter sp.]
MCSIQPYPFFFMNDSDAAFISIMPGEMEAEYFRILLNNGFTETKARACAHVFTENSVDGIYSHGVNRFAKFISYVKDGYVLPNAEPEKVSGFGGIEQWNGNLGPGVLNALHATERATELATQNGIGCVALANTNHWMRGGLYGWKAAKKNFIFIGWSNTIANMPAWKATENKLGNNPLVIAVPFAQEAIVLDMAMSQYSFGAVEMHTLKNQQLAVPGGYDTDGNITTNPNEIMQSKKGLPIGYWKGAGLSLLLDILAAILSAGNGTGAITKQGTEYALSQVFIAIHLEALGNYKSIETILNQIIDDYHESVAVMPGEKIIYPGERVLNARNENTQHGIPVAVSVWDEIQKL